MSEYIIEIPDEYFASYDEERDMYYPDERDSAMPITPIVRCRNCRRRRTIDLSVYYYGEHKHDLDICTRVNGVQLNAEPDGYCAWGERRMDD